MSKAKNLPRAARVFALVASTGLVVPIACRSDEHPEPTPGDGGSPMGGEGGATAGTKPIGGSTMGSSGDAGAGSGGVVESSGGYGGANSGQAGSSAAMGGSTEAGSAGSESGGAGGAGTVGGAGGEPCIPAGGAPAAGGGASEVLYTNDFETPNEAVVVNCGNSLDARAINQIYGTQDFVFAQTNTVEVVEVHDPSALYTDPSGTGKNYSLGMLSTLQDDLLALTFEITGKPYLNVGFDLSSIDVQGCGGPFGVAVPVMRVSLYDTPTGTFNIAAPGTLLDQRDLTGVEAPDPWTFAWKYGIVSLDATNATGSSITVQFDLRQSAYAAFDNLSIVSSESPNVVDRNNDGIPDDEQCLP